LAALCHGHRKRWDAPTGADAPRTAICSACEAGGIDAEHGLDPVASQRVDDGIGTLGRIGINHAPRAVFCQRLQQRIEFGY
jgi:hypothetical protein